ncbi:MAG TPA: FCD domain-containing protein [Acidimicrobiia bacterium]|jgi:DNA-binding FadR family transcriptional regulator
MTAAPAARARPRVAVTKAPRLVAESLRERILDGEFAPDALLPATEALVDEYGVSRPTVREALNVLEADGLVRLRRGPGGGAIVQAPDSVAITRSLESLLRFEGTTIEQLMEVRFVVDPLAARLAAERATAEDLERISASIERQREDAVRTSHEEWFTENLHFHWLIAAAAHNPVVRVLSESLHDIVLTGGLRVPVEEHERDRSIAEHEAVLRCIAARDADGAERRLREHLERSMRLRREYAR